MVFGFAGKIGSGKSTLSKLIAADLGFRYASFGDYVRKLAISRNMQMTRENLQNLGQEMIAENTEGFCLSVLEDAKWEVGTPLVIDGVRHVEVTEKLKKIIQPDFFKLIFLKIENDVVRKYRTIEREKDILKIDQHQTEKQLLNNSLIAVADLVINAESPVQVLRSEINSWISMITKN
jgi:dephospho-CoA kinase